MIRLKEAAPGWLLWLLTGVILAAAVGAAYVIRLDAVHRGRPELRELIAALGEARPIEARITGGFRYAAAPSATRGLRPAALSPDARIAAARLEKAAFAADAPAARAALAVARLAEGAYASAIDLLADAVGSRPSAGEYLSDLAAAHLARAESDDRAVDLAQGLAAAERAIKVAPGLSEAWFNRALALERLFLKDEALAAWRDAGRHETDRQWAGEIGARLAALGAAGRRPANWEEHRARILTGLEAHDPSADRELRENRELAREWIEDVALPQWGAEWCDGHAQAASDLLRSARLIADALVRVDGDRMPRDGIVPIDRAIAARVDARIAELADAHRAFGRARTLFLADRLQEASELFASTEPTFARAGSPYLFWSYLHRTFGARTAGRNDDARTMASRISPAACERYRYLCGRTHWAIGVIELSASHLDLTERHYRAAYRAFDAGGEGEMKAAMAALLAENLFYLGRADEAWIMERRALSEIDRVRTAGRRYTVVYYGAFLATSQNLPEVAYHYLATLVRNAQALDDVAFIPEALLRRARTAQALGLAEQAERDLAGAEHALARVIDSGLRERNRAELRVLRAQLHATTDPDAALADVSAASEYFRSAHHSLRLVRLLLSRGQIARAGGRDAEAGEALLAGIEEFEQQRAAWPDEQLRLSSFDEAWSLFDEAVLLAVKQGDAARALEMAERGRARALLESLEGPAARPRTVGAMQAAMPSGMRVLYYRVLADETLIWTVSSAAVALTRVSIGRSEVERRTRALNAALQRSNAASLRPATRAVYDALVAPISASLARQAPLAIVGDDVVQRVPFAILTAPDGRYLLADHEIMWAPSLSVLTAEAAPVDVTDRGILVAAPTATRSNGVPLAALPDAAGEASDVAALYPAATVMRGEDLTVEAFLREASRHRIVHFAGHGIVNEDYPALSRLVVGSDAEHRSGSLYSFQIARNRMDRTQLVVLSSCSGAAGRAIRGEGVLSLARPFLAAGVATVIAAQWDIPDRGARALLTGVHRGLRDGLSVAASLRAAQLAQARTPGVEPRDWAGLIAIGRARNLIHLNERD